MNEKQFRSAIQINTKCGKMYLDKYCKNHNPEYTDQEYNELIRKYINLSNFHKNKKSIIVTKNSGILSLYTIKKEN